MPFIIIQSPMVEKIYQPRVDRIQFAELTEFKSFTPSNPDFIQKQTDSSISTS